MCKVGIYMTCREKVKIVGGLMVILLLAICYAISWIITCGIIKLITICFGLTFSWAIATGVWLILSLLKSIFSITVKKQGG